MATINFYIRSKKRESAPVFVRLSDGRRKDLIVKSGFNIETEKWSNKKHDFKHKITTKEEKLFKEKLADLKSYIDSKYNIPGDTTEKTKEWLEGVIYEFHHKKTRDSKTLNQYIKQYISDAKEGTRKNEHSMNFSPGTIRTWEGFQIVFNEYQGIYSEKKLKKIEEDNARHLQENKPLIKIRPQRKIDFDEITVSFYESFKAFLSDEGYQVNTIGRFIKALKYFMQRSLNEKKHSNREFQNSDVFKIPSEDSFSIYLTEKEVEAIYKFDLSASPRIEKARDAFIVLCETALRISDYRKVDINIRKVQGKKLIYITQEKTDDPVIIPVSKRLSEILEKYNNKLPSIPDQHINKNIKAVAMWCGITETLHWKANKYGKKFEKTSKKYELISCHTGRRTAATNMMKRGIPVSDICFITGHKTEKQLYKYVKLTPEEKALKLASHPYFNKSNRKAV